MNTHISEGIRRVGSSFLIFSFVLFGLLSFSRVIVATVFRVDVGGELRDVDSIRLYHQEVKDRLRNIEEQRDALVLSHGDDLFKTLNQKKDSQHSFQKLFNDISGLARQIVPDQPDAISIDSFEYDGEKKSIRLSGVVGNVGPRSMTVLATFVDSLIDMSIVDTLDRPLFTRSEDPHRGFISPFTLTFFVK